MADLPMTDPELGGMLSAGSYGTHTPTTVPFPGGTSALYRFRGRDGGAPPGVIAYVTWSGESPTATYSGPLTHGGPVVEVVFWRIR